MKLSKLWSHYELDKKMENYSKNTVDSYRLQVRVFIEHVGDMKASDVTVEKIKDYLVYRKTADNLKSSSVAHIIKSLRSFFNWMRDEDYIVNNPFRHIKTPKQERLLPKFVSEEVVHKMKMHSETPLEKVIITLLYDTACRVGELCQINLSDIDWDNESIIVYGKGSKEREVYLSVESRLWLKEYLDNRDDSQEALIVTERRYVSNNNEPRRMSHDQIRWIIKRIAKRAGINKSMYPHRYRHSRATHLYNNGADLELIRSYLGHESIDTTRIYANLSGKKRKEKIAKYS